MVTIFCFGMIFDTQIYLDLLLINFHVFNKAKMDSVFTLAQVWNNGNPHIPLYRGC
jgi:hypothetical protein